MSTQANPFAVQPITGFTPGGMAAGGGYASPAAFRSPYATPPISGGAPAGGGGFGGFFRTGLAQMGGPAGLAAGALGGVGNYLQDRRNIENQNRMLEQQRLMGQDQFNLYEMPALHQQRQQYAGQQAFRHGFMGNWLPGGAGEGSFGPLRAAMGDPYQYETAAQLRAQNPYRHEVELEGPSFLGSVLGGLFG